MVRDILGCMQLGEAIEVVLEAVVVVAVRRSSSTGEFGA
jgi:hypothetical protein